MRPALAVALVLGAVLATGCDKSSSHAAPQQPAAELIGVMSSYADAACACGESISCLHGIRDQYDQQKAKLVANPSFTPADTAALTDQRNRLKACGDAGGLTFW